VLKTVARRKSAGPARRCRRSKWASLLAPAVTALLLLAAAIVTPPALAQSNEAFRQFVAELWPEAQGMGVSRPTFDMAFRGVEPDLSIPDLVLPGQTKEVKGQAEFTRTPAEYLNVSHLTRLSEQGRTLLTQHAAKAAKDDRFPTLPPFQERQGDAKNGSHILEKLPSDLPPSLAYCPLPNFMSQTCNIK